MENTKADDKVLQNLVSFGHIRRALSKCQTTDKIFVMFPA